MERNDRLACVEHTSGITRIYLTDNHGLKKRVNGDDSFFVDIPFSEENSRALCTLIAECRGMSIVDAGRGRHGMGGSLLFDLI